ncbi:MAG: hypothetical protein Q4E88_01105 [Coriobacteriia bacterium]|nr:hypothetical protein [Coriobacteriia bacterium]
MADQNKKPINKGKFAAIVIGFIALLVLAFFATKCACDNMQQQLDTITKWGITIQLQKDPNASDNQVNYEQGDDYIDIHVYGKYSCPKPGKSYFIDFADISGINDRPLNVDSTGSITFPPESFLDNHVFHCPLVFNIGDTPQGKPITIDGNDYIGRRLDLERDLKQAIDSCDYNYEPVRTDIREDLKEKSTAFFITFPLEKEHMYENLKNAYYEVSGGYKISEIKGN